MSKGKRYEIYVQFDSVGLRVTAKNQREAKRKVIEKLNNTKASKYLDKAHLYIYISEIKL